MRQVGYFSGINTLKTGYGFFKGSLEFPEGAEKVVAGAIDNNIAPVGLADCIGREFGIGAFYLYIILRHE